MEAKSETWKRKLKNKKKRSLKKKADGWLVARVMYDPFHVPQLARAAVPTQTAALGRSNSPTAPPSLPRAHPTDRMNNKPDVRLRRRERGT